MQKGLTNADIISIISDREVTFSISHLGFDSYSRSKEYSSNQECQDNLESALAEYIESWKHEKFDFKPVETASDEVEEVNDSWSALASDVFSSFKAKIFN